MTTNYGKIREMERSYKHFLKVSASIPDFMLKKLIKMPNNKGDNFFIELPNLKLYIYEILVCVDRIH